MSHSDIKITKTRKSEKYILLSLNNKYQKDTKRQQNLDEF